MSLNEEFAHTRASEFNLLTLKLSVGREKITIHEEGFSLPEVTSQQTDHQQTIGV